MPPLTGVAIPAHVVAYAAGIRSAGADWINVAEVLVKLNLGHWPVDELRDAILDWLYDNTEPDSGLFTRGLCGSA